MPEFIDEPVLIDVSCKKEKYRFKPSERFSFCLEEPKDTGFLDTLNSRTSQRTFASIKLEELYPLFHHSNRTKKITKDPFGNKLERRNYPSPGSLCSIHCVVSPLSSSEWYIYNSAVDSFDQIAIVDDELNKFKEVCGELINVNKDAWLIWYVCDVDLLSLRYENYESLAFRESGHISSTQSLVAEHLGLGFCALGFTGYHLAEKISNERKFIGVGTSLVGNKG